MSETLQEQAARLYVPGVFGYTYVAKHLGVSATTVRRWLNPEEYERDLRASCEAKRRRKRNCVSCSASLSYDNTGEQCTRCLNAERRIWTRESIIAAIQKWAEEHGRPPSATEWNHGDTGKDVGHPATSNVYRTRHKSARNHPFASWAEAIEAAGFERPETGGRYRERPGLWKFDHAEAVRLVETGLTQAEVARLLGVSQTSISALVLGNGTYAQRRAT